MPKEKIEILSAELLEQHQPLVNELKQFGSSLRLEFGWHYLLDITWILSQLGNLDGLAIMDAGAGTGIVQWYLADQGATVFSVDRLSRAALPLRFSSRFHVKGLRSGDLLPPNRVIKQRFAPPIHQPLAVRIKTTTREILDSFGQPTGPGQVLIYNQDLGNLVDIPDDSLDAIVAISALEHNTPEGLKMVVAELMSKLKPGKPLLATLTAARDQDWWHEESSAWCYTDSTLREIFGLQPETPSNYADYDRLFTALGDCAELSDNLASFYYKSDNNGMPWGVWDPKYQPVGVCKIKAA